MAFGDQHYATPKEYRPTEIKVMLITGSIGLAFVTLLCWAVWKVIVWIF